MINVNSYKLIIVVYMSHYLVLLILEFLPARLATLAYGLDSDVTQLLANMLTKPSVFYYLPIVPCNLVSIKLLLLLYGSVVFPIRGWSTHENFSYIIRPPTLRKRFQTDRLPQISLSQKKKRQVSFNIAQKMLSNCASGAHHTGAREQQLKQQRKKRKKHYVV